MALILIAFLGSAGLAWSLNCLLSKGASRARGRRPTKGNGNDAAELERKRAPASWRFLFGDKGVLDEKKSGFIREFAEER